MSQSNSSLFLSGNASGTEFTHQGDRDADLLHIDGSYALLIDGEVLTADSTAVQDDGATRVNMTGFTIYVNSKEATDKAGRAFTSHYANIYEASTTIQSDKLEILRAALA